MAHVSDDSKDERGDSCSQGRGEAVRRSREILASRRRCRAQLRLFDALLHVIGAPRSVAQLIEVDGVSVSRSLIRLDNPWRAVRKSAAALRDTMLGFASVVGEATGFHLVLFESDDEGTMRQYGIYIAPWEATSVQLSVGNRRLLEADVRRLAAILQSAARRSFSNLELREALSRARSIVKRLVRQVGRSDTGEEEP